MGGASNYAGTSRPCFPTLVPFFLFAKCFLSLGWEFVSLNVGYGDEGFFVNNTGLQWREDFGFGGWLGENNPSLFSLLSFFLFFFFRDERSDELADGGFGGGNISLRLVAWTPPALLAVSLLRLPAAEVVREGVVGLGRSVKLWIER